MTNGEYLQKRVRMHDGGAGHLGQLPPFLPSMPRGTRSLHDRPPHGMQRRFAPVVGDGRGSDLRRGRRPLGTMFWRWARRCAGRGGRHAGRRRSIFILAGDGDEYEEYVFAGYGSVDPAITRYNETSCISLQHAVGQREDRPQRRGHLYGVPGLRIRDRTPADRLSANPFDGCETIDLMVVAGGDGTVNYVVNAMKRKGLDISVRVIPRARPTISPGRWACRANRSKRRGRSLQEASTGSMRGCERALSSISSRSASSRPPRSARPTRANTR